MNEWEWQLLEDKTSVDRVRVGDTELAVGDRVRLLPRKGGDVFDLALAGQNALIESIEQDYEGKVHVCVVLDDDPGRDLGLLRQPGHRFFFDPAELELLSAREFDVPAIVRPRILVAGIGNIFLGDDSFGVEVVRRLTDKGLPDGVRIVDFGIRSLDLAYALQEGYETTILVDACPRGQEPGTIYVVEPDLDALGPADDVVDSHGMNPLKVLAMAKAMNAPMNKILLVGCEPAILGGDEGHMGLSEPVAAAVDEAATIVESLVHKLLKSD
jgi:hydrogenase maturation protease